jgi:hypothetical protein
MGEYSLDSLMVSTRVDSQLSDSMIGVTAEMASPGLLEHKLAPGLMRLLEQKLACQPRKFRQRKLARQPRKVREQKVSTQGQESDLANHLTYSPSDINDQMAIGYNAKLDENGIALAGLDKNGLLLVESDARGGGPASRSRKPRIRHQKDARARHLTYEIGVGNEQWNDQEKSGKGLFIILYIFELGAFIAILVLGSIQVVKADQYCSM